jgi:hypothetical protein
MEMQLPIEFALKDAQPCRTLEPADAQAGAWEPGVSLPGFRGWYSALCLGAQFLRL